MSHVPIQRAPAMIGQVIEELRALFSAEYRLARQELSTNLSSAVRGIAMVVAAVLFALVALHALALAAVVGLGELGLHMGWAALIVFAAFLAIAGILVMVGKSRLSPSALKPEKTIQQIKTDIETLEEVRHGTNY